MPSQSQHSNTDCMSHPVEDQDQFIIRFPAHIAEQLHAYFDGDQDVEMPNITLCLDDSRLSEMRSRLALKVKVEDEEYKATVMELPTTLSTFKTLDRVNFFKSGDISEMIVVHESEHECENIYEEQAEKVYDRDKIIRFKAQSGVTAPTKYIRQTNFKDKPDVNRQLVNQVDRQLESIRYDNSQNKQSDKAQGKHRKQSSK